MPTSDLAIICASAVLFTAISAIWSLCMFRDWRLAAPARPKTITVEVPAQPQEPPSASEEPATQAFPSVPSLPSADASSSAGSLL